ncbi:MAG: tetratricopeptide repeat protein [Chloroflexota bacterium]
MNQNADPEFVSLIQNGLNVWLDTFKALDEFEWFKIDKDRANIFQLLSFGIAHHETFDTAVSLCISIFEYIERRGYWQEWYALFELAYTQFDQSDQSENQYKLLNCLVQLNILMDRIDEAEAYIKNAKCNLEVEPLTNQLTGIRCSLAQIAIRQGDLDKAQKISEEALDAYKTLKNNSGAAHAEVLLGMVHHHQGERHQAITYYKSAVDRWKKEKNDFWLARTIINLGYCLIEIENYDEADRCFEQAISILAKSNYEFDKSTAHINRGFLYFRLEKWDKAEREFNLANSRFIRESPHTHLKSLIFHNLGSVQIKQKAHPVAEENLNFAVELRRKLGDEVRLASSLGTLGELYYQLERCAESEQRLSEAIALLELYPTNDWALDMKSKFSELRESLL